MRDTNGFLSTLPHGPLVQHVGQIHAILIYLDGVSQGYSTNIIDAAEHSLRQIAHYTADRYPAYPPSSQRQDAQVPDLATVMKKAAKAVQGMGEIIKRSREARRAVLTPEQREQASQARYDRAIALERRKGREYIYGLVSIENAQERTPWLRRKI